MTAEQYDAEPAERVRLLLEIHRVFTHAEARAKAERDLGG